MCHRNVSTEIVCHLSVTRGSHIWLSVSSLPANLAFNFFSDSKILIFNFSWLGCFVLLYAVEDLQSF